MWSNFHTHSHYCDGKGAMRDYLEAARREDVRHLGFSSHAPVPFPCKWCMEREAFGEYLEEIESTREEFPDIEVYKGLELDYIPGIIAPTDFADSLDYTIGSIHFAGSFEGKHWEIDNTQEIFKAGLEKIFQNDIRAAVTMYYGLTRDMMEKSPPDILGHLDKIKINAKDNFLDESESWYIEQVERTLQAVRGTKTMIEANTRGIYKKKSDTTYPSPWILERICQWNIPITLSSDAHHPDDLTREFISTRQLLVDIGFKNISLLKNGIWTEMPLNEYGPGR
jgi:histidinol-phosphatase (PHP family)